MCSIVVWYLCNIFGLKKQKQKTPNQNKTQTKNKLRDYYYGSKTTTFPSTLYMIMAEYEISDLERISFLVLLVIAHFHLSC